MIFFIIITVTTYAHKIKKYNLSGIKKLCIKVDSFLAALPAEAPCIKGLLAVTILNYGKDIMYSCCMHQLQAIKN